MAHQAASGRGVDPSIGYRLLHQLLQAFRPGRPAIHPQPAGPPLVPQGPPVPPGVRPAPVHPRERDFLDRLLQLGVPEQASTAVLPQAAVRPAVPLSQSLVTAGRLVEVGPRQDGSIEPPAPGYPITLEAMKQHKDHPLRMKLEWDEIHRAEPIKEATSSTAGLDEISDFWCAQYALICKDRAGEVMMENVIERAQTLQDFRQQYEIAESYQEGCRALRRFAELCPNYILAFMYDPRKGNYTWAVNPAKMRGEDFDSGDVRDFAVGMYYIHLAMVPDLQAIHKGPNIKLECKDLGWSKRHNTKLVHKVGCDGLFCLPIDVCSIKHYNTGQGGAAFKTMLRAINQICITTLGQEEWPADKKLLFDSYSEGLDSVFLVPDAATAQERALRNAEESLRLRFQNERTFSLKKEHRQDIYPFTDDMVEAVHDARRE